MKSRIFRKKGNCDSAIEAATRAHALMAGGSDWRRIAEALIALGEAKLASSDREKKRDAARDFQEALRFAERLGSSNPMVQAACHVHLASTFEELGEIGAADGQWKLWLALKPVVENRFVHTLAANVQERLQAHGQVFTVGPDVLDNNEEFSLPDELERLEDFVFHIAIRRDWSDADIHKKLKAPMSMIKRVRERLGQRSKRKGGRPRRVDSPS